MKERNLFNIEKSNSILKLPVFMEAVNEMISYSAAPGLIRDSTKKLGKLLLHLDGMLTS